MKRHREKYKEKMVFQKSCTRKVLLARNNQNDIFPFSYLKIPYHNDDLPSHAYTHVRVTECQGCRHIQETSLRTTLSASLSWKYSRVLLSLIQHSCGLSLYWYLLFG